MYFADVLRVETQSNCSELCFVVISEISISELISSINVQHHPQQYDGPGLDNWCSFNCIGLVLVASLKSNYLYSI